MAIDRKCLGAFLRFTVTNVRRPPLLSEEDYWQWVADQAIQYIDDLYEIGGTKRALETVTEYLEYKSTLPSVENVEVIGTPGPARTGDLRFRKPTD